MKVFRSARSRAVRWGFSLALVAVGALLYAFPGQRLGLAFTIATGFGTAGVQQRIDRLEEQAVHHRGFSSEDRAFLVDFYSTLATGGKLLIVTRQTGWMMDHYLSGLGTEYRLEPEIFTSNEKLQRQMARLRKRASVAPCIDGRRFSSDSFYMPDASNVDSVFGLYWGRLSVAQSVSATGACTLHWRAEVPWCGLRMLRSKRSTGTRTPRVFRCRI